MRVRALLFDLFGTVVRFAPAVPTVQVAGTQWRSTMGWLRETAEHELPHVAFDDLLAALMAVTEEIVRQRPPEFREVASRERFRRALLRLGIDAEGAPAIAERLSLAHMAHLAAQTVLPAEHPGVLRALAPRFRMALVSNFDHARTARRILDDHGIAHWFDPIVISDDFGRRKPHPSIFVAALDRVGVSAAEALFIGDSVGDDLIGAANAGIPMAWLNVKRAPLPPNCPEPNYVIERLDALIELLG